jgi:hypothetical protein
VGNINITKLNNNKTIFISLLKKNKNPFIKHTINFRFEAIKELEILAKKLDFQLTIRRIFKQITNNIISLFLRKFFISFYKKFNIIKISSIFKFTSKNFNHVI